ncbi:MAG: electron transfer flavoprotein subunit beta/FixA family protein [Legionellaceae bacterium]|nr:electron transfer flavoprotein subunit beta/FixA family protein [Legionellaceae bacterium]
MKILVPIKRVIDPYVKIRLKPNGSGVEIDHVKMSINPFDAIALEQAVRFQEAGHVSEIVAVGIGGEGYSETLRHALALGATEALFVQTDVAWDCLSIARILQKITEQQSCGLVLMGKQSIDGDNNQTPQMLAALLDWPQATNASVCTIENEKVLMVVREVDGGLETLQLQLPAVVSVDLRLNEPRYASLPQIMKAKQKPFSTIPLESLALSLKTHQQILQISEPPRRTQGQMLDSVEVLAGLIHKLTLE